MEKPLIELQGVTKRFDGRKVLDRIDMKVFEGKVTTIIGKSGVGKSVLLKHIIGLLAPDEGRILFRGQAVNDMSASEKNAYLRQISYMFQHNALFDSLTVYDNIAMPLRYNTNLSKKEIYERVMARMADVDLNGISNKFPAELSGGMQKRVALARALVTDPVIVLFDEPTTGQDPIRKNAILGMIAEYQQKFGFTAVLISHDLPDVFFISNRILALYDGKAIFEGTPEAFDDLDHPFRAEFLESLEALQEELSGFYSKRHFKVRYQMELHDNPQYDLYVVVLFTLPQMEQIIEKLGHIAAQQLIRALGSFITRHFSDIGGFSTRLTINEYVTVLPYSDMDEAQRLVENFAADFKHNGIAALQEVAPATDDCRDRIGVSVLAGLAQGRPQVEIESIIEFARFRQATIAEFEAKCKGAAP